MSASLFTEGFRPAIDFGLSVSRIGNKIQCEAMKELSRKLRLEYVQYKSLQRLTNVQSTLSAEAEARLKSGEAMTHILTQDKNRPASVKEQIVLLYALKSPAFAGLDARGWKQVKVGIVPFLLDTRSALIRDIAAELRLTPRTKERRSEEHTSELQSLAYLVCRLLLEKKKTSIRRSYNAIFACTHPRKYMTTVPTARPHSDRVANADPISSAENRPPNHTIQVTRRDTS